MVPDYLSVSYDYVFMSEVSAGGWVKTDFPAKIITTACCIGYGCSVLKYVLETPREVPFNLANGTYIP